MLRKTHLYLSLLSSQAIKVLFLKSVLILELLTTIFALSQPPLQDTLVILNL